MQDIKRIKHICEDTDYSSCAIINKLVAKGDYNIIGTIKVNGLFNKHFIKNFVVDLRKSTIDLVNYVPKKGRYTLYPL